MPPQPMIPTLISFAISKKPLFCKFLGILCPDTVILSQKEGECNAFSHKLQKK
jgi:hypothetical protein